jgi:hypothetical protein
VFCLLWWYVEPAVLYCIGVLLLQTGDLQGLSEETAAWLRANVAAGRPDLPQLCDDLVSSDHPTSATVFVCGPVRRVNVQCGTESTPASTSRPRPLVLSRADCTACRLNIQQAKFTGDVSCAVLSCGDLCVLAGVFLALDAGTADPGGERDGFFL